MVLLQAVQRYLESAFLSRARLVTTINCSAPTPSTNTLTAEYDSNSFADVAQLSNHELLEVHRAKSRSTTPKNWLQISCDSTTPHVLKACGAVDAYLSNGTQWGLAFLVVVSSSHKSEEEKQINPKTPNCLLNPPVLT